MTHKYLAPCGLKEKTRGLRVLESERTQHDSPDNSEVKKITRFGVVKYNTLVSLIITRYTTSAGVKYSRSLIEYK